MPLSTCTGSAEVKRKDSAALPGTKAVRVPKWFSPRKNTKVAVRFNEREPISRPPAPKLSMRLSPVPVLPPSPAGCRRPV